MHELSRLAYLDAMGIDHYLSRSQLPGAAPTRRLAIVPGPAEVQADPPHPSSDSSTAVGDVGQMPRLGKEKPRPRVEQRQAAPPRDSGQSLTRFSLATIVAGDWLWVEDLQGMPLTREQVQLVQAMAQALNQQVAASPEPRESNGLPRADVARFDWPIHTNQQLDLGEEAAQTALAGFLGRKIDQGGLGLVLLGAVGAQRVSMTELTCPRVVVSHSSAELLADPSLKSRAWAELKTILNRD